MAQWEISLIQLPGKQYKVTRRLTAVGIAETKIFATKEKALKQFHEWLAQT